MSKLTDSICQVWTLSSISVLISCWVLGLISSRWFRWSWLGHVAIRRCVREEIASQWLLQTHLSGSGFEFEFSAEFGFCGTLGHLAIVMSAYKALVLLKD